MTLQKRNMLVASELPMLREQNYLRRDLLQLPPAAANRAERGMQELAASKRPFAVEQKALLYGADCMDGIQTSAMIRRDD